MVPIPHVIFCCKLNTKDRLVIRLGTQCPGPESPSTSKTYAMTILIVQILTNRIVSDKFWSDFDSNQSKHNTLNPRCRTFVYQPKIRYRKVFVFPRINSSIFRPRVKLDPKLICETSYIKGWLYIWSRFVNVKIILVNWQNSNKKLYRKKNCDK